MASTIKVDKIEGSTGSTVTVPTGQSLVVTDGIGIASIPTITVAKGGTNTTSYTTGDTVYASGATAISKLGIGTARQGLQTNSGATAPEWVDSPQSLMTAAGDILYASGANTLAKLAKGSDDDVLTLASGVPSWAAAASGGLSVADQWRLTSNFSITTQGVDPSGLLTTNLERVDTSGQGVIGAMTESSGVFSFPSTGVYLVTANFSYNLNDNTAWINGVIQGTVDDSSYVDWVSTNDHIQRTNSVTTYSSQSVSTLVDVTDVANVKVRFGIARESNTPVAMGNSTYNYSWFTFLRLGDT